MLLQKAPEGVNTHGTGVVAKVADFGLAQVSWRLKEGGPGRDPFSGCERWRSLGPPRWVRVPKGTLWGEGSQFTTHGMRIGEFGAQVSWGCKGLLGWEGKAGWEGLLIFFYC